MSSSVPARREERRIIRQCLAKAARRLKGLRRLTHEQRRSLIARMQRKLRRLSGGIGSPVARMALVGSLMAMLTGLPARAAGPFVVDAGNNPFASITGIRATAAAFGDIDNDGDLDLMLGDQYGSAGRLRFYRNTGTRTSPTFTPESLPTGLPGPTGTTSSSRLKIPAFGDFDNDGRIDLVTADCANASSPTTLTYYRQGSDESFSTVTAASLGLPTESGSSYGAVRFVDLDNDGDDDIILVSGKTGAVSYYRNDGSGTFSSQALPFSGLPVLSYPLMAFADIDGDADLDVFVGVYGSGVTSDLQYYRNDAGTLASSVPATEFSGSDFNFSPKKWLNPSLVDLDGDGDADLVIGDYENGANPIPIHFRRNTPPAISSLSPVDDSANVGTSTTFTITFSGTVAAGGGSVYVKQSSDNSTVATLAASSLDYSGAQASFTPSGLVLGTGYYITWDATAFTVGGGAVTGNPTTNYWSFTTAAAALPSVTSANYDASTGALVITGADFAATDGATNDVIANKFTLTGEGGSTYTLTDTPNVEITGPTSFTLALSATDGAAVNMRLNKNGSASTGGTTYNLAGAAGFIAASAGTADLTANGITVSNVASPSITSATYDASTGALVVTGTNLLSASGSNNDVVANKLSLRGEGGVSYTLTDTPNVDITSGTSFTVTLSATDRGEVNRLLNKNGTTPTAGLPDYNLAAAEDWAAGADAAVIVADTSNLVTVSNVPVPTITDATYNANTGVLVVTGTGFVNSHGPNNDIDVTKLTIAGEGGGTRTLIMSGVELTSATQFSVTLTGANKTAADLLLNKNGTSSLGGSTYNLAAAEDWAVGADAAVEVADLTGNAITVSAVNTAPIAGLGSALDFERTNSEGVQVADNNALDWGTSSFTVEAWIKRTGSGSGFFEIAGKQVGGGGAGWFFRFNDDILSFGAGSNGVNTAATITDANWHHVAAVLDATGKTASIYIDGVVSNSSGFATASNVDSGEPLGIGFKPNYGEYFDGSIDDVRIWTTARTASEIREYMRTPLAGTEAGLVGYWNFEDGSGTVIANRTATSGLDGTLQIPDGDEWITGNIPYSVNTLEDTAALLRLGGSDLESQSSATAVITALPTSGDLYQTNDGSTVGAQISSTGVALTDTDGNPRRVLYVPDLDYNGADSFTYQVNDGSSDSANTVTVNLTISAANDAPVATAGASGASYSEGGSAAQIDNTITIADTDSANLVSATVQITGNHVSGDRLNFTNQNGISGSFNAGTGVLTLTGSATTANYETALKSVTFDSTSDDPTDLLSGSAKASRTITWTINDGAADSSAVTSTLSVSAVNDAPSAAGLPPSLSFTEDSAGNPDLSTLGFADPDSVPITVTLTASTGTFVYAGDGNDPAATLGGIATSVMTITGAPSTVNLYLSTPTNITYTPAADVNGSPGATIAVKANDGSGDVSLGTINLNITAVNDAPVLAAGGTLVAVDEDTVSPDGAALNTLGITANDTVDAGTISGYAIVGNTANSTTQGAWQYSTNAGTNWHAIGSVGDDATALALSADTLVRFVPVLNFNDAPAVLTIRALDGNVASFSASGGSETRATIDTTTTGGTTFISSATASIATTITLVNDAPTDLALSAATINQSAGVNGVVGTLSATDVDDSVFTFTLVAGVGADDNASFNISGTDLRANDAGALAAGTYSVRVQADDGDTAGTYADAFAITVVDDVAPAAPSTPDLAAGNDTGGSNSDNITTSVRPTFSGTAEAGSTIEIFRAGSVSLGTTVADGSGDWTFTPGADLLEGTHTITAAATDAAINTSVASGGLSVTIDLTASTVQSVSVPADATYVAGQDLDFTVNWNENVTVDTTNGIPSLALMVGSTSRTADFVSGSGSTALVFRYTTQAGDLDANGITIGALSLNSGTIKDAAGNNATLMLNSVGSTANVNVDAVAPTVTGLTVPVDGTYEIGQILDFTVSYSENVTVVGTPYIEVTLDTGGTVQAAYNGGTGTTTLTFRYTVASGNEDTDGIVVASEITLNGGLTIKDGIGNDAQVTSLAFDSTGAVLVDGVAPTVSSIERETPTGVSTNATSVVFRVTFAEPVSGVDTTDFTLTKTDSADGAIASIDAVSGTVYDVTVDTVTGNGTLRLDLNNAGTGITDAPGNAIGTGGYTSGQTYTIDNTAPAVGTIVRENPTTVNTDAASVTWRVTFDADVTGVDAGDFALTVVSGTAAGTIDTIDAVDAATYDVTVSGITGQGQLRLDLKSTGTGIADLAGNPIANGGFTAGDSYFVGATSVFDTVNLSSDAPFTVNLAGPHKPAQRFTTAGAAPLSLTTVIASVGSVMGTPEFSATLNADNSGAPGTVIATLTNPTNLVANALNVWTASTVLDPNTTYWIVFHETSGSGAYEIKGHTLTTSGGSGTWLTGADYSFRYAANSSTVQTGALLMAIGATSVPSITSTLTASGTYGAAFSYQIVATNTPTSYAATNLPPGLSLDTATGLISGSPAQSGTFNNITLTATNGSGTGAPSTLVLTIGQASATVSLASLTKTYTGSPLSPTVVTSPGGIPVTVTYNGSTTAPTAAGSYSVLATVNDPDYTGSSSATFTITKAVATISLGNLSQTYDGTVKSATATTVPAGLNVSLSYDPVSPTQPGSYTVTATVNAPNHTGTATGTLTIAPAVTPPPVIPPVGGSVQLSATDGLGGTGQWQRNGSTLPNSSGPSLTLPDVQPPTAGLYTYTATLPGGGGGTSEPVIVGLTTTDLVVGTGEQVGADIVHPNGNVYDQVLLEGNGASITSKQNKVTRLSFVDLTNDIVQVEFSGAGTLSVVMDDASQPAPPINYNQENVDYVRGHVGLVITGANETSNLSIISVGPITAVNQSLFKEGVTYDGVADVAFVAIQSANGKFGGIRTGNVHYYASQGFTGVYAPGVEFAGPINIGEVTAFDSATPVLVFGSAGMVNLTGGNLEQDNGSPVTVSGIDEVRFVDGQTSQGVTLPAQQNKGVLIEDGVNVTSQIVVNP